MSKNKQPGPSPLTVAIGGTEIEVTHLPLAEFHEFDRKRLEKFQPLLGAAEVVKVHLVPVSRMPFYSHAFFHQDEATLIEIYCGKEPGWADTLCQPSVEAVAQAGFELNEVFFCSWWKRQTKLGDVVKRLMEGFKKKEGEPKQNASPSPISSTESPNPTT